MNHDILQNKIRGCLYGGAVGDALGYPVEFLSEASIFSRFGSEAITHFPLDALSGNALISDDTQMTLFTANGLLYGDIHASMQNTPFLPRQFVSMAYQDWLRTQESSYAASRKQSRSDNAASRFSGISWLLDVPELYSCRAPGNTCISALSRQKNTHIHIEDYIQAAQNDSKGCGGIMRVAPLALDYQMNITDLDYEGAQLAAITHGHSLGYMPAAVLTHILNRIVFPEEHSYMTLKEIILEARDTSSKLFAGDWYLTELTDIIDLAVQLSENKDSDLTNINRIGEGWVAEETLGIALYCTLRHSTDFSAGVIAAVNHKGDSDSTGAVTGNILGALLGYEAIEQKWKEHLELSDIILTLADDIFSGHQTEHNQKKTDSEAAWARKYKN